MCNAKRMWPCFVIVQQIVRGLCKIAHLKCHAKHSTVCQGLFERTAKYCQNNTPITKLVQKNDNKHPLAPPHALAQVSGRTYLSRNMWWHQACLATRPGLHMVIYKGACLAASVTGALWHPSYCCSPSEANSTVPISCCRIKHSCIRACRLRLWRDQSHCTLDRQHFCLGCTQTGNSNSNRHV